MDPKIRTLSKNRKTRNTCYGKKGKSLPVLPSFDGTPSQEF